MKMKMHTTLRQRFVVSVAAVLMLMGSLTSARADKIIDATQYTGPCYTETVYSQVIFVLNYTSEFCGEIHDPYYGPVESFDVEVCPEDYFAYLDYSIPGYLSDSGYDWTCGYWSMSDDLYQNYW